MELEQQIVRFTFTLAIATDGSPEAMDRCLEWADEIAEGMQEHHFAANDIAGTTALSEDQVDVGSGNVARWSASVDVITLETVGEQA